MQAFTLTSHKDGSTLYDGKFNSFLECLEHAINDQINLQYIDLSHQNLTNANLDDAYFKNANFSGANLTGANMSECHLNGANFNSTALYNTYFCYSTLQNCDFKNASFGATDITGADISGSQFSTLSCFDLEFNLAKNMGDCHFQDVNGTLHKLSHPPIIIKGLPAGPIIFMDNTIKITGKILPYSQISTVLNKTLQIKNDKEIE